MVTGSKPGERRGGRQKGTPNKTTAAVKEAVLQCYKGLGGHKALLEWAKDNKADFYTKMYVKLLPLQVEADLPSVPLFALPAGVIPDVSPKKG